MINVRIYEHATLNVTFSLIVKARRKNQALEMADFQLNEKNMILERIRFVNEQGLERWFIMERIEAFRWTSAESTEYSNLFKAVGQIRLTLRLDRHAGNHEDNLRINGYRLPRSVLQDRTVWVIQTANEPAFTQVLNQSLEFLHAPSIDTIPLTNAG